MEEDEDDVCRKGLQRWPSSHVQIKTAGCPPVPPNGMLPCQVHNDPRRFLYGNAGLLLLAPANRSQPDRMRRENVQQAMDPPARRPDHSVETLIGQKLQLIGDQFYQELMMHQRNQRNREPLWRRVAAVFYALLFGRDAGARDGRVNRR